MTFYNKQRGDFVIINYDIKKISSALLDFYNATGIDMDLLKPDFSPAGSPRLACNSYCRHLQAGKLGERACELSDRELLEKSKKSKQTEMQICHAGLMNVAIPLLYDDIIIGYIIFGRMKPNTDFDTIKNHISKLGIDTDEAERLYTDIPIFKSDKIKSVSNIAIMLAKYILLKNMISPDLSESMQKAVDYIEKNLENELSVKKISRSTNISKSVLYKNFHSHFNCTVSEFINTKRVEKAIELITSTELSLEEIAQKVGFSSGSYFSKTFKKQMGMSPLKYKNHLREV